MRLTRYGRPAEEPLLRLLRFSSRWSVVLGLVLGLVLAIFLFGAAVSAQPIQGPNRIALVIGNAAYQAGALTTSANDAGLVAETLAQVGFDVTAMANTDSATLAKTVLAFEAKAKNAGPDALILVYLSGYGLQLDGDAFFVPVDAKIERGADVPVMATRLSEMRKVIEAVPAKAHIFIYDLARENPFVMKDGMPLAGGFGLIEPPGGSLYAMNAAPGTVGVQDAAPYGAYARALAEMIQTPDLSIDALFERVRLRVGEYTNGAVIPWDDGKLDHGVILAPQAAAPVPLMMPTVQPIDVMGASDAYATVVARDTLAGYQDFVRIFANDRLAARVKRIIAARREALFWAAALRANDASAYWTFMRRYPRGSHYYDARRRLAMLPAALEPPPRFDITRFPDLPPPSPDEAAIAVERSWVVLADSDAEPIPAPPVSLLPPIRSAFTDDLPPPPFFPTAILPIPVPVRFSAVDNHPYDFGRIVQPFVSGEGEVLAQTSVEPGGGTTVTLTNAAKVAMSHTITTIAPDGRRTITQTGPNDVVVSRTTIIHDNQGSTIVQTGTNGGVLTKSLTWTQQDGVRSTLIRDGGNRIVADIRRNAQGIVITAASDAAPRIPVRRQAPMADAMVPPPSKTVPSSTAERAPLRDNLKPVVPKPRPSKPDATPAVVSQQKPIPPNPSTKAKMPPSNGPESSPAPPTPTSLLPPNPAPLVQDSKKPEQLIAPVSRPLSESPGLPSSAPMPIVRPHFSASPVQKKTASKAKGRPAAGGRQNAKRRH